MKRWFALLLSTCLILALVTGCGGPAASSAASQPEPLSSIRESANAPEVPASTLPAETEASMLESVQNIEVPSPNINETLEFFPADEGSSFSWFFTYMDGITPDDSSFFREMMSRTGVTVDWTCPSKTAVNENFNLMIASGDWTDLITGFGSYYTTGINGGLADGIILELNDLIADYMPAYSIVVASNEEYTIDTKLDDGSIGAIYGLQAEGYPSSVGMVIRKD